MFNVNKPFENILDTGHIAGRMPIENTVDNAENAGNQHFLFFPQCFLL